MKIVQINHTCGVGSTGKICLAVSELLNDEHIENYVFYSAKTNRYKQGTGFLNEYSIKFQALKSRIFGNWGFNSNMATKRIIKKLKEIKPDIVHIHNIHGHDCNIEKLFKYFKSVNQRLYWTFHDCWAFTGYCTHFSYVKCDKWKEGCCNCPQYKQYSFFFDKSKRLFNRKKELFNNLDLTIITPSQWLADLVKQSFLKEYPVKVIYNGIDLKMFKPTESNFRERYSIPNSKYILLGIAFDWSNRKGLDVFIELSKRLNPEKYQIVLVGTENFIDKILPKNIISIQKTRNQSELAEIYSSADLLINPTREEVFGMVNIEALACGTPVVTFNTGGCVETIDDSCGTQVKYNDIEKMESEIKRICENMPYKKECCVKRGSNFDKNEKFKEYIELYFN